MASTSRHIPARARGLAVLLGLALPAIGQTLSFSSISSQCVNPSGFETCWANVTSTAQTCKLFPLTPPRLAMTKPLTGPSRLRRREPLQRLRHLHVRDVLL